MQRRIGLRSDIHFLYQAAADIGTQFALGDTAVHGLAANHGIEQIVVKRLVFRRMPYRIAVDDARRSRYGIAADRTQIGDAQANAQSIFQIGKCCAD